MYITWVFLFCATLYFLLHYISEGGLGLGFSTTLREFKWKTYDDTGCISQIQVFLDYLDFCFYLWDFCH